MSYFIRLESVATDRSIHVVPLRLYSQPDGCTSWKQSVRLKQFSASLFVMIVLIQ